MAVKIPEEVVDEVRQQTNIVDVVGQYVQLKKTGKNFFGFCPFHDERTPSFSVTEEKQIYHCFSCGRGGNVFNFLMELEQLSFPEAVAKVADYSQISLPDQYTNLTSGSKDGQDSRHEKLIRMHTKAASLYHHVLLNTQNGEAALAYLEKRGLTKELMDTFQIGFAPAARNVLAPYLTQQDCDTSLFSESGLFIERDDGELRDRFYDRIMFPIRNEKGKIVAFSGRSLPKEKLDTEEIVPQAKYLNSPETLIFNKRNVLFNFDLARNMIRKTKEVILFEGFMDVIAAWQAGVQNGIASMGTSLTNEQIHLLDRVTDQIVICYDGDTPGVEAANRGVALLQENTHFDISVVSLPEKLDPDDYIHKYGAESFQERVRHGRDTVIGFKMRYLKQQYNLENEQDILNYVDAVLSALVEVPSAVERDIYFNQLANQFQISMDSLQKQFREVAINTQQTKKADQQKKRSNQNKLQQKEAIQTYVQQKTKLDKYEIAQRLLLYRMFHHQWVRQLVFAKEDFVFSKETYQTVYWALQEFLDKHGEFDLTSFLDSLPNEQLQRVVTEIEWQDVNEEVNEKEIYDCLSVVASYDQKTIIEQKQIALQEARRTGDKTLQTSLTVEIINLNKALKQQ